MSSSNPPTPVSVSEEARQGGIVSADQSKISSGESVSGEQISSAFRGEPRVNNENHTPASDSLSECRLGVRGFPVLSHAKPERNAEVAAARALGETYDAIASKYGISRQRVEQIVKGQRPPKQKARPLAPLIAYAEEAIPRWRSNLEMWRQTGYYYRGRPIDAEWLAREAAALRELEMELASWRQRQREGYENDL